MMLAYIIMTNTKPFSTVYRHWLGNNLYSNTKNDDVQLLDRELTQHSGFFT